MSASFSQLVLFLFITVIFVFAAKTYATAQSLETDSRPVVVELFTSQSCSSCPPADRVLDEISGRQNVIALGCHVTYWDHLHWKDTLSQKFCTDRQYKYAGGRNSRRVFTPEALINGHISFVGSSKGTMSSHLRSPANKLAPVSIAKNGSDTYEARIPASAGQLDKAELVIYGKNHTQHVKSGENRGKTVTYTNPVMRIQLLTLSKDGNDYVAIFGVPETVATAKGFAVLVHRNGQAAAPLIAAGKHEFPSQM